MLCCALFLLNQSAIAQSPQWQVQPSICINEQAGDFCEFELDISLMHLPAGQYCVALGESTLRCASSTDFPLKIHVKLAENQELFLINAAQQPLLSLTLVVKSRHTIRQRRRLRNPWSLF